MGLNINTGKPNNNNFTDIHRGDRSWKILIIASSAALILSVIFICNIYEQRLREQYDIVQNASGRLVTALDHELFILTIGSGSMESVAHDYLLERNQISFHPVNYLKSIPEKDGYYLDLPPGYTSEELGALTGVGDIPDINSSLEREMSMAFSLTPMFTTIAAKDSFLPWVYYTSVHDFIYMYPRVSNDEFFYSKDLKKLPFITGGLPENNPDRKVFWSPVYEDAAGKGLMVTVSIPVYDGDQFIGCISTDIIIKYLSWILDSHPIPNSTSHLVDANNDTLVYPIGLDQAIDVTTLPPKTPVQYGDVDVTVYPLQPVNWYAVVKTQRRAVHLIALEQSIPYGVTAIFLLCSLVLAGMLSRSLHRVRILSLHDSLTGLENRRAYDEISASEFSRLQRYGGYLGLAILDIDYFKKYNDTYGHRAGDKVLRDLATTLTSTLRRASDKLFRVGGEEFALLLILNEPEQMAPMMERICQAVRNELIPHEESPQGILTISVGAIVISGTDWMDMDTAYQKADQALYRAKNNGRNRVELDLNNTIEQS
jgi:diguanylate cyclase (GGDEF)-like protein